MNLRKALTEKGRDRAILNLCILGTTSAIIIYILLDGPGLPEPASSNYRAWEHIEGPTDAQLDFEYTKYFKQPCLDKPLGNVINVTKLHRTNREQFFDVLERSMDEDWINYVKTEITNKARPFEATEQRKEIYKIYRDNCGLIKLTGEVL